MVCVYQDTLQSGTRMSFRSAIWQKFQFYSKPKSEVIDAKQSR